MQQANTQILKDSEVTKLYHILVTKYVQIINKTGIFTVPGPSVHGPPIAKILAPISGMQAPSNPAATLRATPMHRRLQCSQPPLAIDQATTRPATCRRCREANKQTNNNSEANEANEQTHVCS